MQNFFDLLQRRIWLGPLILVIVLGIGLGLGLLVGWVILPVTYTPSSDDVQAIADSYALNNDLALARSRLQNLSTADQVRIVKKLIADSTSRNKPIEAERVAAFALALRLPLDTASPPPPQTPTSALPFSFLFSASALTVGAIFLVTMLVLIGGFVFARSVLPRIREARQTVPSGESEEIVEREKATVSRAPARGSLGRFLATYHAGLSSG